MTFLITGWKLDHRFPAEIQRRWSRAGPNGRSADPLALILKARSSCLTYTRLA